MSQPIPQAIPPAAQLMEMIFSPVPAQALSVAAKLGVADLLKDNGQYGNGAEGLRANHTRPKLDGGVKEMPPGNMAGVGERLQASDKDQPHSTTQLKGLAAGLDKQNEEGNRSILVYLFRLI
jgi:hypothetical protein